MLEKPTLSNQFIIDSLRNHYGIETILLTFLPLGADMNASVYKVLGEDEKSYFIKIKKSYNAEMSIAIAKLLSSAGIDRVICPIKTIHGQHYHCIENFTLIVYPFIEGEDGFQRKLTNDQWIMLGKILRQIHEITVPDTILNKIRRETYSDQWRNIVKSLYSRMEHESKSDGIALKLVGFLKENRRLIQQLVDRAEQLSQKLKVQNNKFMLCHADIHGGNVLIDEKNQLYVIDWDDPMLAPKERDLMFIGGGVANVWNDPNEEAFFYNGYGKTDINRAILAYYRHERIVEDIALYSEDVLFATMSEAEKQKLYELFMSMFEPNGVVDIAFKTAF